MVHKLCITSYIVSECLCSYALIDTDRLFKEDTALISQSAEKRKKLLTLEEKLQVTDIESGSKLLRKENF